MEILNTTDSTDFLWAMAGFPVAPHPRRFHAVFMDLRRLSLSLAIALAATLACPMEAEKAKDIIDRFELWTDSAPLRLIVEQHRLDSRIQVIARSRLRAARIYDDNGIVPNFYIYINVSTIEREGASAIYSIDLGLHKMMLDLISGEDALAESWNSGSYGRGGDDFIMQSVSEHMDEFIDEYLRINADSCD